jgi:glycine betaine catabolism A
VLYIERLYRTGWLCVGRSDRLRDPGDFIVHDKLGDSVIVVRHNSGVLHAFHNVCRHRGTRLCEQTAGRFHQTIQCPYHAWTYSTDGRLLGAPHMQDAKDFSKKDYPLLAVPVVEWEGFVFISLSESPEPFELAFAPVLGRFERFGLASLVRVEERRYEVRANWKLILQNYNECLHCPIIHPELNRLLPYTSGANDLFEGPFLGGYMEVLPEFTSVTVSGRSCGVTIGTLNEEEKRRAYYYTFFPNAMLSIHSDYVTWYTLWPLDPGRTLITCEWLMHRDSPSSPDFDPQGAIELWDVTNGQDWHICEQSQAGVSSRAYRPGPYSPRESVPAAWDRFYLRAMGRNGDG